MEVTTRGNPLRATGVAFLLAVAGVVFSVVLAIPAFFITRQPLELFVWATVLSELGFVAAAVLFLAIARRGWEFLNLRVPSRRDLAYAVGGIVALVVFRQLAIVVVMALDLPVAGNAITEFPGVDVATVVVLLIPISIVVIGPAEEILFRGVVQRYLYGSFSTRGAIVLASVVFTLVHLPTSWIATSDPLAVMVTLAILFGLSLLLGWLYARTDNLVVPILAHGFYDAVVFGLVYYALAIEKLPAVF